MAKEKSVLPDCLYLAIKDWDKYQARMTKDKAAIKTYLKHPSNMSDDPDYCGLRLHERAVFWSIAEYVARTSRWVSNDVGFISRCVGACLADRSHLRGAIVGLVWGGLLVPSNEQLSFSTEAETEALALTKAVAVATTGTETREEQSGSGSGGVVASLSEKQGKAKSNPQEARLLAGHLCHRLNLPLDGKANDPEPISRLLQTECEQALFLDISWLYKEGAKNCSDYWGSPKNPLTGTLAFQKVHKELRAQRMKYLHHHLEKMPDTRLAKLGLSANVEYPPTFDLVEYTEAKLNPPKSRSDCHHSRLSYERLICLDCGNLRGVEEEEKEPQKPGLQGFDLPPDDEPFEDDQNFDADAHRETWAE